MKNLHQFDKLLPMDMVSFVPWAGAPTERYRINIRDTVDHQTVSALKRHVLGDHPTAAKEKSFQVTRLGDMYELKPTEYVAPGDFVTFYVGATYKSNAATARLHCFQLTQEQLTLHGTLVTLAQYRVKCPHLLGVCVYRFIGEKASLQATTNKEPLKLVAATDDDPVKSTTSGTVGLFITALNQLPNPLVLWDVSGMKETEDEALFNG